MSRLLVALCLLVASPTAAQTLDDEAPPPVVVPTPPAAVPAVAAPVAATPPVWPSSSAPPGASVGPRRVHAPDVALLAVGGVLFGLGYVGAVAWAGYYFAELPVGVPSCNDGYAGLHLVPFVGPPIGLGVVSGCVAIRTEEALVSVGTALFEIVGGVLFAIGLAGRDHIEYEGWSLSVGVSPEGGRAFLDWAF